MSQRQTQPNIIVLSSVITACGKASRWEKALDLLEEMPQRGLQPDVIMYNALIKASLEGYYVKICIFLSLISIYG